MGRFILCFDVSDQEAAIEKEIALPDPSRFSPAGAAASGCRSDQRGRAPAGSGTEPGDRRRLRRPQPRRGSKSRRTRRSFVDPGDRSRRSAQFSQHPRAQSHRQKSGSHRQRGCRHGTRCDRSLRRAGEAGPGDLCGAARDQARLQSDPCHIGRPRRTQLDQRFPRAGAGGFSDRRQYQSVSAGLDRRAAAPRKVFQKRRRRAAQGARRAA